LPARHQLEAYSAYFAAGVRLKTARRTAWRVRENLEPEK
jgi:hypothetical protein